jgi:hypothetical protein
MRGRRFLNGGIGPIESAASDSEESYRVHRSIGNTYGTITITVYGLRPSCYTLASIHFMLSAMYTG